VTFVERDGKTTLINRVEFASVEDRDGMLRCRFQFFLFDNRS